MLPYVHIVTGWLLIGCGIALIVFSVSQLSK